MSDIRRGGQGRAYFGQRLAQFGSQLQQGRPANRVNANEQLRAQQLFNQRFAEWQANNVETPFTEIENSYEEWLEGAREEIIGSEDLFTNDATREAFSGWMEEAGAVRRVPVAELEVKQRQAHNAQVYQSNVSQAVATRDENALVASVYAAAQEGTIREDQIAPTIDAGMYEINLAEAKSRIGAYADEWGYEAARELVETLNPEDYPYSVGVDDEGNAIQRTLSREDFAKIRDEVREELKVRRQQDEYKREEVNRLYDETADGRFAEVTSSGDITGMWNWLHEQRTIDRMNAETRYKWISRLKALQPDQSAGDEAASAAYQAQLIQGAIRKESIPTLYQGVIEGLEIREDGTSILSPSEARSLISFIDSYGSDPIADGLYRTLDTQILKHEYSAEVLAIATRKVDDLWRNQWSVLGPDGRPKYVADGMSDADLFQSVQNIVDSTAVQLGEADRSVGAAYRIEAGEIVSRNGLFSRMAFDTPETVINGIEAGQYVDVDPNGSPVDDDRVKQLWTLRTTQQTEFERTTGARQVGRPLWTEQRSPMFYAPVYNHGYEPINGWFRYTVGQGAFNKEEVLQFYHEPSETWRKVEIRQTIGPNNDQLRISIDGVDQ